MAPCAHLVGIGDTPQSESDFHWIYRDSDGDVHDPSPVFKFMPANDERMRELKPYALQVLTIALKKMS
jgi:hypothetical protein